MSYVLIVDDDLPSRDALCHFLGNAGHHVECVANGQEALASVLARRPDVIVLDLHMPEMDGPSLLEILRAYLRLQSLPVVVLTGQPDGGLAERMRSLGVDAMLQKGDVTLAEVGRAIEAALDRVKRREA